MKFLKTLAYACTLALGVLGVHSGQCQTKFNPSQINWGTAIGCNTAGYVYSPQSNSCVAQNPGGPFFPLTGATVTGPSTFQSAITKGKTCPGTATSPPIGYIYPQVCQDVDQIFLPASIWNSRIIDSDGGTLLNFSGTPCPVDPLTPESNCSLNAMFNVLVGPGVGAAMVTGNLNTFIGTPAGQKCVNCDQNVAIGSQAFNSATSAYHNVAVGAGAAGSATTDYFNVFVGTDAGLYANGSYDSVTVGASAGSYNATSQGTFIGTFSGTANTTGYSNTCIGYGSCPTNTTGYENTVIGAQADTTAATGIAMSVAIGFKAKAGSQNSTLINDTGSAITNSTKNTFQYDNLPIASTATFSVSGCGTAGSLTGSGLSGTFTAGATSCTPVIVTGVTAPHGFVCFAADWTTPADLLKQASATTTTATFAATTVVNGDTIGFTCRSY